MIGADLAKIVSDFAYRRTVFCVCPQGVLRRPARCFAYTQKVARIPLSPCAKASRTQQAYGMPPACLL